MEIDLQKRGDLLLGLSSATPTDDGLLLSRFDERNAWAGLTGFMQSCSAGIRVACATDATRLRLVLRLGPAPWECDRGRVDVLVGDRTVYCGQPEAPWTDGQRFVVETPLPAGRKEVTAYLPTYRRATIESFALDGATFAEPVRSLCGTILFIGDSITQGYGSSPADCYAARYARLTGRDFLNLGIGGARIPETLPDGLALGDYDEIVLSLGANDAADLRPTEVIVEAMRRLIAFVSPHAPRITVGSPVSWPRGVRIGRRDSWERVSEIFRGLAAGNEALTFVDGSKVLPWDDAYFVDGIHPNTVGAMMLSHAYCAAYRGR